MPYIETKTSIKATDEQKLKLKEKLGEAIALIPGKSEAWLMTRLEDCCTMSFKGDMTEACAIVEIDIFGAADKDSYDALTSAVCDIVNEVLGVKRDRIYIKYRECDIWGFDGYNL